MDAHSCQHAGGDGDGGAESRHALQKAAEAETDEQDEHAGIHADGFQHFLDGIDALGMDRQMVGVDGGNNDEQNRPAGKSAPFQRRRGRVAPRHAEDFRACHQGQQQRNRAGLPCGHPENAQRDNEPENRQQCHEKQIQDHRPLHP